MARDWYRSEDWNEEIAAAFEVRLKRARETSRPQYLRIQASYLVNSYPEVALSLLERYFPLGEELFLPSGHILRAEAYLAQGSVELAVGAYEAAIASKEEYPNVETGAELKLAYLIAQMRIENLYDRALELLELARPRLMLPVQGFKWHASQAIVLYERRNLAAAADHVDVALQFASRNHSGFPQHPNIGLVTDQHSGMVARLQDLARTLAETGDLKELRVEQDTIGGKIEFAVGQLPPEGVTLAEIRDLFGNEGLMLLSAFLTLVFLVPVSIPGVSTVFGGAILLFGINRLFGWNLWLPRFLEQRVVPSEKIRVALDRGLGWFRRFEKVSRPHRLGALAANGPIGVVNNLAFILGAVLLMAPFGLIPFSNTFPAVALLFLAIGFMQRDGVCILLGHIGNVVTILYFTLLITGGSVVIYKAFQHFFGSAT